MKKLKFSSADRRKIASLVVGKPSGTIAEIGGFEFDLLPLTTGQADRIFAMLETIYELQNLQNDDGTANVTESALIELIAREGKNVRALLRDILYRSAVANDILEDEEIFDEWFDTIELKSTVTTLLPLIVQANGLGTMMGNSSTPPSEPETTGTTEPASLLTSVS